MGRRLKNIIIPKDVKKAKKLSDLIECLEKLPKEANLVGTWGNWNTIVQVEHESFAEVKEGDPVPDIYVSDLLIVKDSVKIDIPLPPGKIDVHTQHIEKAVADAMIYGTGSIKVEFNKMGSCDTRVGYNATYQPYQIPKQPSESELTLEQLQKASRALWQDTRANMAQDLNEQGFLTEDTIEKLMPKETPSSTKPKCTCSMDQIMYNGCKCGGS